MQKRHKQPSVRFIITVLLCIAIVLEIAFLLYQRYGGQTQESRMQKAADSIMTACANTNYHPSCYDKEIPKIMDEFSMEQTLAVTSIIQHADPSYAYCHVLGHELSARETRKDPGKWKDVVTRCPSGVCSNGCIHGAFQERFRTDVMNDTQIGAIKPELADVCEPRGNWKPTGMEQSTCYHALGHLMMYITGADTGKSLNLCDELAGVKGDSDHRAVCYDGVFMQTYQPLEPEDFALIRGKEVRRDTRDAFCNPYAGQKRGSCISESWPLFFGDIQKPGYAAEFCGVLPTETRARCMSALFYILVVQFRFDLPVMRQYCAALPGEWSGLCFASIASRLIETDWQNIPKSIDWCTKAQDSDGSGACWKELDRNARFIFRPGSEQYRTICEAVPTVYKDQCNTTVPPAGGK